MNEHFKKDLYHFRGPNSFRKAIYLDIGEDTTNDKFGSDKHLRQRIIKAYFYINELLSKNAVKIKRKGINILCFWAKSAINCLQIGLRTRKRAIEGRNFCRAFEERVIQESGFGISLEGFRKLLYEQKIGHRSKQVYCMDGFRSKAKNEKEAR